MFFPTKSILAFLIGLTMTIGANAAGEFELKVQLGHPGSVGAISLSNDGRLLATAGDDDGKIILWDVATGRELRHFVGHKSRPLSALFFNGGSELISAGEDQTVRIWNAATGAEVRRFALASAELGVNTAVPKGFSLDGKLLIAQRGDGMMQVWDVAQGKIVRTFKFNETVWSFGVAEDGTLALTTREGKAKVWNVQTGVELQKSYASKGTVAIVFSRDGRWVARADKEGNVEVIDARTGASSRRFPSVDTSDTIQRLVFSLDGERLAVRVGENVIVLDLRSTSKAMATKLHRAAWDLVLSNDGRQLISASDRIDHWDVATAKVQRSFSARGSAIQSFSSIDNTRILVGSVGASFLVDTDTARPIDVLKDWSASSAAVSTTSIAGTDGAAIRVASKATFAGPAAMESANVTSLALRENMLAAGTQFGDLEFWDVKRAAKLRSVTEHGLSLGHGDYSSIRSLQFSADGSLLASASADRTLRLWNPNTGKVQRVLKGHTDTVNTLTFTPNGKQLVSGSDDRTLGLWSAETGARLATFSGHTAGVSALALNGAADRVASASEDRTLRVWNVSDRRTLHTLRGHADAVTTVSFTSRERIVSGSRDGTLNSGTGPTDRCWQRFLLPTENG